MAGWSAGDKRVLSHAGHRLSQEFKGKLALAALTLKTMVALKNPYDY
jgi:hypothetical protein